MWRALVLLSLMIASTASGELPRGRVVDLTHAFGPETIYWPTADPFHTEVVHEGMTPGGYYYAAKRFSAAEHGGTHVDAPVHFARGRHSIDEVPVEQLIGPVLVVDVSAKCARDHDYQITVADLEAWQKAHRPIGQDIVLLRTGWATRWPDKKSYLGTDERGQAGAAKLHFPGLHPEAARWLAERHIKAVGIDTASIDPGISTEFLTHRTLFTHDIPAFENVADLGAVPAVGATVVALPMKIAGGTGAPLRIIAILP